MLVELLDEPMAREKVLKYLDRFQYDPLIAGSGEKPEGNAQAIYEKDTAHLIEIGILEESEGKIRLTPKGRDVAEHTQKATATFGKLAWTPETVSKIGLASHVVLTVLKFLFGFLSGSAGLIADGIDNGMDTVASVLVWMGIRFDKQKLSSVLILVMMFVSVIGVAVASYNKIVLPESVESGLATFIVSAICGVYMLVLSAYQYTVSKRSANFAILCQAIDSRNHFITSLLVCVGIVLSFLADTLDASWLYYADAAAGIIVGVLLFKSALELLVELFKPEQRGEQVTHFVEALEKRTNAKLVSNWLKNQPEETKEQLEKKFSDLFCGYTPTVIKLAGMGYSPQDTADLDKYLDTADG